FYSFYNDKALKHLFFTLVVFLFSLQTNGQPFTESINGSFFVSSVQSLHLSGGAFVPAFSSLEDFAKGITVNNYLSVSIKSNVPWTLSVHANNTFFTALSQGGSLNMPAQVLRLKLAAASQYFPLSANPQTL